MDTAPKKISQWLEKFVILFLIAPFSNDLMILRSFLTQIMVKSLDLYD